jgi:hypothetical protein
MEGFRKSGKGDVLRLHRSRPQSWRRDVDEAAQAARPIFEPPDAVQRPDHAESDRLELIDIANRAVEEETVARIGEALAIAELEQRFVQEA